MKMLTFIRTVNKRPPFKNINCATFLPTVAPAIERLVSFKMLCHTLDVAIVFINSRHLKHKTITRYFLF